MTVATAAAFHPPWVGAATLMLAGLGAEIIDLIAFISRQGI
jgi:hypothetical protein